MRESVVQTLNALSQISVQVGETFTRAVFDLSNYPM